MRKKSTSYQKYFKAALATSVAAGAMVFTVPNLTQGAEAGLKDLDKTQDYYGDVLNLVAREVLKGFPDGTYKPHNAVTRGQAAKILANVLDLDTKNVVDPGFTDVKKSDEYYGAIAALAKAEIIKGYPDKRFGQADTLTRSQMAKIITIGFGLPEEQLTDNRFTDVKKDDEFSGYVQAMLTNKITKGTTSTTFSPARSVSRGQMASFVVRSEKAVANTEITAKIESFTEDTVVLSTGTFPIPKDLKDLLNPNNVAALNGAILNYSIASDSSVKINSVELTASGTSTEAIVLDGQKQSFPGKLIVNGDYITVQNLTIEGDLEIGSNVENNFLGKDITVEGKTVISNKKVAKAVAQASSDKVYKSLAFAMPAVASTATVAAAIAKANIDFENSKLGTVNVSRNNAAIQLSGSTSLTAFTISANSNLKVGAGITVPAVKIEGSAVVLIDGEGKVSKLDVVSKTAKITLGANTGVSDLTLPSGSEAKDVVQNYEESKGNIDKVGGETNVDTKPVTPPSTGGGGGSVDQSVANVSNIAQLKAALADSKKTTINITKDIVGINEPIEINRKVNIKGISNHQSVKLEFTEAINQLEKENRQGILINEGGSGTVILGLTVKMNKKIGWQGMYGIQVYNAKNVQINSYTGIGADAALLVNGSEVSVSRITTKHNEFGGMEVSKGENLPSKSKLTINGYSIHEDAEGKPAVWVYPEQGFLIASEYKITKENQGTNNNQTYYDLRKTEEVRGLEELNAALANTEIEKIRLRNGFEVTEPIIINRKVEIDGDHNIIGKGEGFKPIIFNENKINSIIVIQASGVQLSNLFIDGKKSNSDNGWTGLYGLQVYNAKNVELKNLELLNSDAGLLVNSSDVTADFITTKGNRYGGIEVSRGVGENLNNSNLKIDSNSVHEDADDKPAIWVYKDQTLVADEYILTASGQGKNKNQDYYNLRTSIDGRVTEDLLLVKELAAQLVQMEYTSETWDSLTVSLGDSTNEVTIKEKVSKINSINQAIHELESAVTAQIVPVVYFASEKFR